MVKPSARRRNRTKQAILEAALDLIHDGGAEALSMRKIASRVDYSAAALYEYFESKGQIIAALSQLGRDELAAGMQQVDGSLSPREYLRGLGSAYIRFAADQPEYFQLIFGPDAPADNPVESTHNPPSRLVEQRSPFGLLLAAISRGIQAGEFQVRPGFGWLEMAYSAWATVHGLAMLRSASLRGIDYDLDDADGQALANFCRGLSNPE